MILYTDIDKFCCKWLDELVKAGLIPYGDVLCADMAEIDPESVRKYTQRHWCCGIGGWPRALQLAGWPIDRPIDSCSLPCQPWSCAGKQKGKDDERHIWPAFRQIISVLKPTTLVGEQVPAAIRLGWLDGIFDEMEDLGYACGAIVAPACSVGSPHIRQRLFWVADCIEQGLERLAGNGNRRGEPGWKCAEKVRSTSESGGDGGVADAEKRGNEGRRLQRPTESDGAVYGQAAQQRLERGGFWSASTPIPCADSKWRRVSIGVDVAESVRLQGVSQCGEGWNESDESVGTGRAECGYEIEPALFPLAHGLPGRVGLLRGAGNAIVPQVAAEFIKAYLYS